MRITDHIRQFKVFLVVVAIMIVAVLLIFSHLLVKDLERDETKKMEVWAEAMRTFNEANENTDLSLVLKVLNENHTIPVIVLDSNKKVQTFRNIRLRANTLQDSLRLVSSKADRMKSVGKVFKISNGDDFTEVCYDDSSMIKRLKVYPFMELAFVLLFLVVVVFILLSLKRAEQNNVWTGLSKETAHQLGTPISSLSAWIEILKETYPDDSLIPEMHKDIDRLRLIADRFSKIGSVPELTSSNIKDVMNHVVDYMDYRTSRRIKMVKNFPDHNVFVKINTSVFEWVIENLCKNAADAIGTDGGVIKLTVEDKPKKVIIEVSDTGKGIKKKNIPNVFRPGFTTKQRGWGLGLSLAKRIIEEYHHGKIFVKFSEVGRGTTFRIELNKN